MKIQLEWDSLVVPVVAQPATWRAVVEASSVLNLPAGSALEVFYEDEERDRIKIANDLGIEEAVHWAQSQGLETLQLFVDAPFEDDSSWDKLEVPTSPMGTKSPVAPPPPLSVGPAATPTAAAPVAWESASESGEDEHSQLSEEEEEEAAVEQPENEIEQPVVEEQQPAEEEEEDVVSQPPEEDVVSQSPEEDVVSQPPEEDAMSQPADKEDVVSQPAEGEDEESQLSEEKSQASEQEVAALDERTSDEWREMLEEEDLYTPLQWYGANFTEPPTCETTTIEQVETLVSKIVADKETNQAAVNDLSSVLLRMAADKQVVDCICNAMQDVKLRQTIVAAANAELQTPGDGARIAKLRAISVFPTLCAKLVDLFPEFESVLLDLLCPKLVVEEESALPVRREEQNRVFCDRCQTSEDIAAEAVKLGFRNPHTKYICGIRYKSVTREDFDLCAMCEESNEYQATHGPFLKLPTLAECPDVIVCIPKAMRDMSLSSHLDLARQPALARELAEFLDFRRQRSTAVPPPPPVVQPFERPSCFSLLSPPVAKKSCKHTLKAFETSHMGFHCDGCLTRVAPRSTLYGCRVCNFDLCSACFPAAQAVPPPPPPPCPTAEVETQEEQQQQQQLFPLLRPIVLPQAKFVCDVTLADGSVVRAGERLEKTWRIRNVGEEEWPAGTKLAHVGGDAMGGPRLGKEMPLGVKPGETVNVSIDLVMPTLPGRYTSYWRLLTPPPASAKFGHRFWVTVNVVPLPPPPAAAAVVPAAIVTPILARPPPPPAPFQVQPSAPPSEDVFFNGLNDEFALSVARIVDFGFTDMDKIVSILQEENGDTGRTIDRLLAGDQ